VSNSCSSLASGQLGLGLLDSGELFLRRLGDEVAAAVEAEIGEEERIGVLTGGGPSGRISFDG
jgi:hypothetical protein